MRLGRGTLLASGLLAAAALAPPALADLRTTDAQRPFLDTRDAASAGPAVALPGVAAAAADLRRELGQQGIVRIDPLTGAPRVVERLDGFLTAPQSGSAVAVARGYLQSHAALFGANGADVDSLVQAHDYVDIGGTHHVSFAQRLHGVPVFGGGVKVNVTENGQVVNVLGSPRHDPGALTATPTLTASAALGQALADGGAAMAPPRAGAPAGATRATDFAGSTFDQASLVYFDGGHGLQLAWHTYAEVDSQHVYEDVVDATGGQVLFRNNIVDSAGLGNRWFYIPFVPSGGFPLNNGGLPGSLENFAGLGWMAPGAVSLNGNNAHVYADVNDDNVFNAGNIAAGDDIPPSGGGDWNYALQSFGCGSNTPCSWDSSTPFSWGTNIAQNGTQVFFYVNAFHDHLQAAPIGFTPAAGNFQADGNDAVQAQVDDGANKSSGLPDQNHMNNANMATPADGNPPRMQMYLFTGSAYLDANGGDDASVIYHEYTHGLSNRLVTDANNLPSLFNAQARSMGEAWSDWYAMDFIIKSCVNGTSPGRTDCWDADVPGTPDVWIGQGVQGGPGDGIRSQPLDCPVGSNSFSGDCNGGNTPHVGGYTYADFGHVTSGPEVHADGEIWAETLWQLRDTLGPANYQVSENLVTRALELSPPDPSFLDERDAIMLADRIAYGGAHIATMWQVFANRGMGWSASTTGSADTAPHAAFDIPPTTGAVTTGTVHDTNGAPVAGATITAVGHADLLSGVDGGGNYAILLPSGSYNLVVTAPGFEPGVIGPVAAGAAGANAVIARDWAALSGGARLISVSAPDLSSFGCGAEPAGAFDLSRKTGWLSTSTASTKGPGGAKAIVVQLPQAINVSSFAVDPTAPCGATPGAAVGQFTIETSPDGVAWTVASAGAFSTRGGLVPLTPSAGTTNVSFVRFTMTSSQAADVDGTDYTGVSEIEVYGNPPPPPPPPPPPAPPAPPPSTSTDTRPPVVTNTLVPKQKLKTILKTGIRFKLHCNEACTLTDSLTLSVAQAKKLKVGKKVVRLGSGTKKLSKAGTVTLNVKLTATGKKLVKRFKKLPMTSTVVAKDAHNNKKTTRKVFTLKR